MARKLGSILALMAALKVFAGDSWNTWRTVLKTIFGGELSEAERTLFFRLSGRTTVPAAIREVWLIIGRRAGKSIIAALIAVYMTTCRTWRLSVGETGVFMIFAADRRQAKVLKNYIAGLLRSLEGARHAWMSARSQFQAYKKAHPSLNVQLKAAEAELQNVAAPIQRQDQRALDYLKIGKNKRGMRIG